MTESDFLSAFFSPIYIPYLIIKIVPKVELIVSISKPKKTLRMLLLIQVEVLIGNFNNCSRSYGNGAISCRR